MHGPAEEKRRLTADQKGAYIYGQICSGYLMEAKFIESCKDRTAFVGLSGWAIAMMQTAILSCELAVKTAWDVQNGEGAPREPRHDWIPRYQDESLQHVRDKADASYATKYLALVKRLGDQVGLILPIGKGITATAAAILDRAVWNRATTAELFKKTALDAVDWKRFTPGEKAPMFVLLEGVPIVLLSERTPRVLAVAQCPTLLRYAAEAIITAATGYQPEGEEKDLMFPDRFWK